MKFTLERTWEMMDEITVEAEDLNEAMEKAYKTPLSTGRYVPLSKIIDSWNYEHGTAHGTVNP